MRVSRTRPPDYRAGCIATLLLALVMAACAAPGGAASPTPPPRLLAAAFAAAAQREGVPEPLLVAVAYVETRWDPALSGSAYGVMGLYDTKRHDGTLTQASTALGVPVGQLESDPATNILGAATVLAADEATCNGSGTPAPARLDAGYCAAARYAGLPFYEPSKEFADYVFAELAHGLQGTAADGETLAVPKQSVRPDVATLDALQLPHLPQQQSDYPSATLIPTSIGFGSANRPDDGLAIRYIVIHDTEEGYPGTVRVLTDPDNCCGANYIVDGADAGYFPAVTQLVAEHDVAYHAGNLYYNRHAIGIEHVGFANAPGGFYTEAMYQASARLVAALSLKYLIPIDRAHLLGHGDVPGSTPDAVSHQHWDPGSFWDWPYYLALVRADVAQMSGGGAPPAPAVDAQYQSPRGAIRAIAASAAHGAASDVPAWSSRAYIGYAPVFADDHGKPSSQLVRGASDPSTVVDAQTYNARDFSCDTVPEGTVGAFADPRSTSFDLRAKADYGEVFALLGTYRAPDGTAWDEIDFNGVAGWVRAAETADGWGAIVTFGASATALYGNPGGERICDDAANGFSRAGQSYVTQEVETDESGATWYAIDYNHHVAWVPAGEVTIH